MALTLGRCGGWRGGRGGGWAGGGGGGADGAAAAAAAARPIAAGAGRRRRPGPSNGATRRRVASVAAELSLRADVSSAAADFFFALFTPRLASATRNSHPPAPQHPVLRASHTERCVFFACSLKENRHLLAAQKHGLFADCRPGFHRTSLSVSISVCVSIRCVCVCV